MHSSEEENLQRLSDQALGAEWAAYTRVQSWLSNGDFGCPHSSIKGADVMLRVRSQIARIEFEWARRNGAPKQCYRCSMAVDGATHAAIQAEVEAMDSETTEKYVEVLDFVHCIGSSTVFDTFGSVIICRNCHEVGKHEATK